MANRITTISGVAPHQMRKICRYAFGDYFHSLELSQEQGRYIVQLRESIGGEPLDKEVLIDFKKFWGENNFRFFYADISEM